MAKKRQPPRRAILMAGIKAAQRRPDAVYEMCFVHRGRRYRMSFTNLGRAIVKSYTSRDIVAVSWPGAIDRNVARP